MTIMNSIDYSGDDIITVNSVIMPRSHSLSNSPVTLLRHSAAAREEDEYVDEQSNSELNGWQRSEEGNDRSNL